MFERFTDKARRVIVLAEEEAKRLNHTAIRPEHVLLALCQGDGVAAYVLGDLGVRVDAVRTRVQELSGTLRSSEPLRKVPFSPRAKKTLELALREALQLGHNYIGTEHILLGSLRESERSVQSGVRGATPASAEVLGVDVDLDDARTRILELLKGGQDVRRSPALGEAERRARQRAGGGRMTTGDLLSAMLADQGCQVSRALHGLGLTAEAVQAELDGVPLIGTSDAPPRPRAVEIKLGDTTTRIEDAEIAAALGQLTAEQIRARLRLVLGDPEPRRAAGGASD